MPGTLYRQHSADPFLYVADDTPDCWSAFLLNTNENYTDPTIDFKKIWSGSGISTRYNGSILFCRTAPAQLGPDYHEQLRTLIREKVGEVWSFCLVWIMDPDAPLSTDNLYVLPLWERTTSQYEVKREDTFVALDGIAEWTFLETVRAVSDIQNNYSEVRFPTSPSTGLNTRPHAMTFGLRLSGGQRATERQSDQIPADTYIAIPTNGPGCGCIRFEMDLFEQDDLLAFDLGQRFFYSADGNGSLAQFHYPLLRSARAGYRLRFQVSLDPANLTNRKADPEAAEFPARTYLAFTGHTEHTSGGQIIPESTVLESHLATHNGYGLDLAPYLQSLANPSALHPLMAGEESARIVFCEKRTGSQEAYYAPAGSFSLLLKSSDREQAIVDDRVYLQSGLSGTESLAYSPDNGNRIHFLPYRPAFSPQFPLESGDSSDVPLLTDECQTSWITLQADGGPQNLYLSQPEGASLYTQSHGINAVTPITPAMLGHFQPAVELPG
ncbi:MAG: hypothetical protein KDC43_23515, partial [Saprospiraceae bacterium]|nr:hypothetical protein [Saprospiraceae bacterium]